MSKPVMFALNVLFVLGIIGGPEALGGVRPDQAPAWTVIGPPGGSVVGLARDAAVATEYYALTCSSYPCQFFRSTNGGASWARTKILPAFGSDLAADPKEGGVVYVLTLYGIYKSVDRGANFSFLAFPAGAEGNVGRIAIHPTNPKIIYVAGK
jgi:hypothetical protein